MSIAKEIEELRNYNTRTEPIHLTGLPIDKIPPDTPNYLTDRTYYDILDGLACGIPVTKTLGSIGCEPVIYGRILTWFYADEERKKKYLNARAIGAEILADEMLQIADGDIDNSNPIPDEIARQKLKIDTRRFLISVNNRARFGTESKVEVKVDLVKALEAANDRITKLPEYTVIEGEVTSE
jgi:hypothetical protein